MPTLRFGPPPSDAAEQVTLQTRWGGPSAKPASAWRDTFVYGIGVTNSAFSVTMVNPATGQSETHALDSTARRTLALTHPLLGIRENGFNAVAFWDAGSVTTGWAADLESLGGRRPDLIQGINTDVDGEWLALSDGQAAAGDIDAVLTTPLGRYASHPSVIAYCLDDDLTNDATHGRRAGELMAAIARIDGRPATPSFLGNAASDAVADADWRIGLFGGGGYPVRWDSVGVARVEGDFTHPDSGGGDWWEWTRSQVLSKPAGANIWWWLQAHQLGDGSNENDLHYPTANEIRKQVWESVGAGARGILWFVYQDNSDTSAWVGLGSTGGAARMAAVKEMGRRLSPNIRRRLMTARPTATNDEFAASGGGSSGWKYANYADAYCSTLYDSRADVYYVVVCNRSTSPASVTISSGVFGTGTLVNLEDGSSIALGGSVSLAKLDGSIWRYVPTSVSYWWDPSYDSRLVVSAQNASAVTLHDHLLTIPIPAGVSVDPDSLRVTEVSSAGSVVVPWAEDGRYGTDKVNRFFTLPASVSGGTLTVKVLGRWASGETRSFRAYWDSTSAIGPLNAEPSDILFVRGPKWTVAITAGTATDLYRLVVNGVNCDYTMQAGDTATVIAAALVVQINGLSDVHATSSSGTVTLTLRTDFAATDIAVANTGSTQPSKVVVSARPNFFDMYRVGPDTETLSYNPSLGVPYGTGTSPAVRVGFGWNNSHLSQTMSYKVDGDGATYDANTAVVDTVSQTKHGAHLTGTLTYDTRSADVDWTATYVCDWEHKLVTGRKSDDTGSGTLNKQANVFRVVMTYVCNRAYTPATTGTTLLTLMYQNPSYSGDATMATANKIPNFSAPLSTGVITPYSTTTLAPAAVLDTLIAAHGSQHAMGIVVNDVQFSGFGSQSPGLAWTSDASAYAYLGITGLSNGATIPQGATITVDFTFVDSNTNNPTTTGDTLLPDELVALFRGLDAAPSPSVAVQTYASASLRRTMELASAAAFDGAKWFRANALTYTGRADNYAYAVKPGSPASVTYCDDNDSHYGIGHMIGGLSLRYERTHDPAILPVLFAYVQMLLTAEAELVALYGSWWSGAVTYWMWPGPNPENSLYVNDHGFSPASDIDPYDGGAVGSQTYAVGQVRRACSIDQLHLQAMGIGYHFCYLLRNEPDVTGTQVYADACAYLGRMAAWEAAHFNSGNRRIHNIDDLVNGGGTPTHNMGATVADTYQGDYWRLWVVNDGTNLQPSAIANSTLDNAMAWIYSPDVTADSIANHIRGRAHDFLGADWSRHDMVTDPAVANRGIVERYPTGWEAKVEVGTVRDYTEDPRTTAGNGAYPTETHYTKVSTGGNADTMYGRTAQRLACMVIGEWLKPGMTVDLEWADGAPTRSITLRQAIDDTARTFANYLLHPATSATRGTAPGFLQFGQGSNWDPARVDATFAGYWMMAAELWLLLDSGADVAAYYRKSAA